MNLKKILILLVIFAAGITAGGYLLRNTQPRSFLAVDSCKENCLDPNELLGLMGSVFMQNFSGLMPSVIKETDKTIAIDSPIHEAPIHYVIIPKKDIKNVGDISESDKEYLIDAYAVIGEIIREQNITQYKVYTNGPYYQTVTYLHFHLLANAAGK